jgi:hypothetical protein
MQESTSHKKHEWEKYGWYNLGIMGNWRLKEPLLLLMFIKAELICLFLH